VKQARIQTCRGLQCDGKVGESTSSLWVHVLEVIAIDNKFRVILDSQNFYDFSANTHEEAVFFTAQPLRGALI